MVNGSFPNVRSKPVPANVELSSRKSKIIPDIIVGVKIVKPAPGMEGTLNWLMLKSIHKYWAFFSNLTYTEMISLREENIDWYLQAFGAQGTFCLGARRKILRSVEELRSRSSQIKAIDPLDLQTSCETISSVLQTPISDNDMEEDGTFLTGLIMQKITEVVHVCKKTRKSVKTVVNLLKEYIDCKSVLEYDKTCAKRWLTSLKLEFLQKRNHRRRRTCPKES